MMRPLLLLLVLLPVLLSGCDVAPEVEEVPAGEVIPWPDLDAGNLLSIANGVVVIDRTGELKLDASAMQAIDSDDGTAWVTTPGEQQESMTIELAALTELERVGYVALPNQQGTHAKIVRFEGSTDGSEFFELATVTANQDDPRPVVALEPRPINFLRVTTEASFAGGGSVAINSLLGYGREIEAARVGAIEGLWALNQRRGAFFDTGRGISGAIDKEPPMLLAGGGDGRMLRFAWIRGGEYGVAVATVNRTSEISNILYWYQWTAPLFFGTSLFGRRLDAAAALPVDPAAVADAYLRRTGAFPLYGLRFSEDGMLDRERSEEALSLLMQLLDARGGRVRLVAHEFRKADSSANRAAAEKRLESLRETLRERGGDLTRIEFVASGSGGRQPETSLALLIESRIDVEFPGER